MTDEKMVKAVAQAIEDTRAEMDALRDLVPRQKREPYFDKPAKDGKPAVTGYRSKLLEAQARAAIKTMEIHIYGHAL